MATLETNPKMLNLMDRQNAMAREVTTADLRWFYEKTPHVSIRHLKEEAPISAINPEEDCNDYRRGYPFMLPTDNNWQLEYYPRYETERSNATLTSQWTSLQLGEDNHGVVVCTLPQRFHAVMQMINFCKLQGWTGVHITSGTEFMKWAVWAYCDYLELEVTGYDPSDYDKMRQTNVASVMLEASKTFTQPLIPSFVRGGVMTGDAEDEKQ